MKQKWHAHFLAHFVILSVFAGVTPLIELATCSSVTNAAKRVGAASGTSCCGTRGVASTCATHSSGRCGVVAVAVVKLVSAPEPFA